MSPRSSASTRRRHDARTLSLTYPEVPRLNARRIDICLTAARIFIERGYDATSVNDVASALGMTKAGLYHYISSKESLLYEIVNYSMDALDAEVVAPVRGIRDPEERLRQILLRHASLATCHDGHVTQLTDELQALPPALRKKIERRKREYFDLVRNTLLELKSARAPARCRSDRRHVQHARDDHLAAAVVQAARAAEQRRGRRRGDQAGARRAAETEEAREAPRPEAARAGLSARTQAQGSGLKA